MDQKTTRAHSGSNSAYFSAGADYLITPQLINAQSLSFWTYTTSADPDILVETSASASGPWTAVTGSPFSGNTGQWNERVIALSASGTVYVKFNKNGSGSLYIDDVTAQDGGTPVNNAPVLAAIGDQATTVSNALNFSVFATDTDNDLITLTASNLPPSATFNSTPTGGSVTGQFSWAVAAPTGTTTTTFYADDGTTNVSETITITITNAPTINVAPVLAPIGPQNVTEGQLLTFPVSASDANNDPLTYTASNLPPGAVFSTNTITPQFTWAPAGPVGVTTSRFTVADGTTNDFEDVVITVSPAPNNPPVIAPIGNQSVALSNALSFAVSATDIDNDLIMLSAQDVPPGAVFTGTSGMGSVTGQFDWVRAAPAGVYTSRFYAADGSTNVFEEITLTVTNPPPPPEPEAAWNVVYNTPYQSGSGSDFPGQFEIRNALVDRIDALESGDSAVLATFTFSAEAGAGSIMNAMNAALDRGAAVSFIADGDINLGTVYGGTNSLLTLSTRPTNPLTLAVDGSTSGIMHDKLGLFDYGGTNQWVFIASWNFTLGASANQWNIALEARSPSLYSIYMDEATELLAGRFHDDPAKSHAHDGLTFALDGSWGTGFARFSPPPDGNTVEDDIIALIDSAQDNIVFALNKLNRTPVRDALIAAANRGVTIQGVMPRSDTDPGGVSDDVYNALTNVVEFLPAYAKADYSELDSGEQNLIHAKYMVIDSGTSNAIVIHGSANWTAEALVNDNDNDENTVFLRHNKIAAQFYNHFERITGTGAYSEGNSTIVSWNFNDADRIADGGIAANATQTVDRVPDPSSYSYTSDALSSSGWKDGAGTTYWETSFSTIDHVDIKVSSVQLASSTGPSDFKLQYKIGAGGTYADVPYSEVHVPDSGNGVLTRVLLPDECENQSEVFLRWLLTSNYRADGTTAIGSTGAGRIDDIIITGTAYNQPPILDPIGSRTVFEGESLSFTVTASDPVDGDPITLTAANLPTGAVFTNGVFTWDTAAPAGSFLVTFIATDKDGSDSEVVTITVIDKPLLLISEVADPNVTGGDAYRFVEIYNAGNSAIRFGDNNWHLSRQNNGSTWYDVELSGTIPAAGTWVVANNADDFQSAYGLPPDQDDSSIAGNGNDAYALFYGGDHSGGILIDIYGELDTDGEGTAWDYENSRAERLESILSPNPIWTSSEWRISSGASTNSMTPGQHGPRPQFVDLNDVFVFPGDNLSLEVTAVNTVRTDTIELSASALPAGAVFPTVTDTDQVTGTLTWNNPPLGIYTATFNAEGFSGNRSQSIQITVSSTTRIDTYFYGWEPDTIVKLENGQFWRNTGGAGETVSRLRSPDATITNVFGQQRMIVESVPSYTTVEMIDVTESGLDSAFSGLHNETIYEVDDGTVWQQVSYENIPSSVSPVTVWRWTENGDTFLRFLDRYDVVIGTCEVTPSAPPTGGPVISRIDGYFRGWQNDRIFVLENGQFWQQITADSTIDTLYRPTVTIVDYLETGTMRLYVEGALPPGYVEVQQRTDITRTAIDGMFYGFGNNEIFRLQNGQWWQQTSLDSSTSTRSNPEVLVWGSTIEMPDEGRSVSAEQLNIISESTITETFRGLRYAHIYMLANGQDWAQVSFENIPSDQQNPTAILWNDNGATRLLARDRSDRTIGNCTVISPWADDDGDGVPNIEEMIAGTSLLDRNDLFMLTFGTLNSEGRAVLRWPVVPGRTYTIEWTPSLLQGFQTLETLTDWTQNSWTDTINPPGNGGFYQIRVRLTE